MYGLRTFGYYIHSFHKHKNLALACHVLGKNPVLNRLKEVIECLSRDKNPLMQQDLDWLNSVTDEELRALSNPPILPDDIVLRNMSYHPAIQNSETRIQNLTKIYYSVRYDWLISALMDYPEDQAYIQKLHAHVTQRNFIPNTDVTLQAPHGYEAKYGEFGQGFYRVSPPYYELHLAASDDGMSDGDCDEDEDGDDSDDSDDPDYDDEDDDSDDETVSYMSDDDASEEDYDTESESDEEDDESHDEMSDDESHASDEEVTSKEDLYDDLHTTSQLFLMSLHNLLKANNVPAHVLTGASTLIGSINKDLVRKRAAIDAKHLR